MRKSETKEIVQLSGGTTYITKDSMKAFKVVEGNVLVYVAPYTENGIGRRFFLHEALVGETIPALCYEHADLGVWCFVLIALDTAKLEVTTEQLDSSKASFAKRLKIALFDIEEFEEQMVEKYQMNLIKEEGYIYATSQEQEATYVRSLKIIYKLFSKKRKSSKTPESGNRLYDAVATVGDHLGITLATFDTVKESYGRRFTVNDIARLSNFISRDIIMEDGWFTKDSGAILAFTEECNLPVPCIPKGPNGYEALDPQTGEMVKITKEYANTLSVKGIMLYRPFPNKKITVKELFKFGMRNVYKRDIFNIFLFSLIGTLIGLLIPTMNEQLYDNYIPMGDSFGLTQICLVVLSCVIGNMTFTIVKNLATFRSMNGMEYVVQNAVYDRLFNLPESFFREYDSADLATRAMSISSIYNLISDVVVKTLLSALFSLLYLWRMFNYSSELAWISIAMLLGSMVIIGFVGWKQVKLEKVKVEQDSKVASVMYQLLTGISKIRIAGVENRALYEYLKPYSESKSTNISKERLSVVVSTIMISLNTIYTIVLYYLMINNNVELSIGAFMGYVTAFGAFSGAMLEIVSNFLAVNAAIPMYKRSKPILETLPEHDENTQLPGNLTGDIEVSNLSFAYDSESGLVLKDLSLHIKSGEYIGLVGSSGCGKSTLLKLLLGFENPTNGKIFYDGKDIDSMNKREMRKKLGVVLQDGKLISGSIFENITITSPNSNLERVKEVISEVGLEKDITKMPMGLHTVLSENSGTISGGQQQRLLIARAIIAKPKIIFFDEATSALDNVTQALITESLEKLKSTKIVIAHRLSTVVKCDRILVMDKGVIVEQGNYEELMEKRGLFYELASRQMA